MEEFGLSERELEILELLAAGASNKEMAAQLVISTNTVKVHLRNIYTKLNVNSRTEAAMFAIRNNLVSFEGIAVNGDAGQRPYTWIEFFQNLGIGSFKDRPMSWYLTLGLVGILLIGIIGMLIIIKGNENDAGLGGLSSVDLENQRWQILADLPTARTGLAVTTFENQIYAIGGETKKGISDFVERFDPLTNTWERLADKPSPVADIQAVSIGGLIYVPGGRLESGEATNVLEVFDPRSENWRSLAPIPIPLSAYAAVAFEGQIFVFGGWDGEKYGNSVFSYDPQTDVWTEGTAMQTIRGFMQAEVAGGAIFVMGGLNETGPLDVNEAYFPQRENTGESPWQARAPMPEPRYAFALTSVADILHVIGGLGTSDSISPRKYSPQEDVWQAFLPPNQESWSHMGVASIEGFLYVLGGQRGDRISSENLSYKAIYTIALPLVQ
jgi:DNA-binding CsgD family transcriptional regulator/N-acetylneuraminic acid mutarotase